MRRWLIGWTLSCAVALACGTELDTSLVPGAAPDDGGRDEASTLPDGAPIGTDGASNTDDAGEIPNDAACAGNAFEELFAPKSPETAWKPENHGWRMSALGATWVDVDGGAPRGIAFDGLAGPTAYLERDLVGYCSEVEVSFVYYWDGKTPFEMMAVEGVAGEHLTLAYDTAAAFPVQLTKLDKRTHTAWIGGQGPSAGPPPRVEHELIATLSRNGRVHVKVDNDKEETLDVSDQNIDYSKVRIGIFSSSNTTLLVRKVALRTK